MGLKSAIKVRCKEQKLSMEHLRNLITKTTDQNKMNTSRWCSLHDLHKGAETHQPIRAPNFPSLANQGVDGVRPLSVAHPLDVA